jgi:DNA transformation protein
LYHGRSVSDLIDYLPDVFRLLGPVQTRRMFGGHGVYLDGVFFAIVDDDVLYLKADAESAHYFRELGLPQFEYVKDGKAAQLLYFAAPAEVLDDAEQASVWGRLALDASLRATARAARRKPRR